MEEEESRLMTCWRCCDVFVPAVCHRTCCKAIPRDRALLRHVLPRGKMWPVSAFASSLCLGRPETYPPHCFANTPPLPATSP